MFGTVLENVVLDPATRAVDFDADWITENTRACYPIHYIPNHRARAAPADIPKNIVFLTADAFGVLPPIARLTAEQAMYHFLSGYTAKVAGTERGRDRAAGHLPRLLRRAVPAAAIPASTRRCWASGSREHGAKVWLVEHRLDRRRPTAPARG